MIQLGKDETLLQYWQKRNGIRLKIQKTIKSFALTDDDKRYLTAKEIRQINSLHALSTRIIDEWKGEKMTIDIGLKHNDPLS